MTSFDGYFELGKIIRAKGVRGELQVLLDSDNPQYYKKMESLLLQTNQQLVPFFIVNCRIQANIATIQLEGINTMDLALDLVGKIVYLPIDKLPLLPEKRFYYHQIFGAGVIDKSHGFIGNITQIYDVAGQSLAEVKQNKKEILFPLREAFIERFDSETKNLYVDLPEGLIEIYLEK